MEKGNDGELTQITFPHANYNQYWRAIKVDTEQQTVVVHPRSNLALHTETLRKQVESFTEAEHAAYTPVNAPGEVEIFGVYLSPLVRTHVFIGPFTMSKGKGSHPTHEELTRASPCCEFTRTWPYQESGSCIEVCITLVYIGVHVA
jgi:hypothetical protein